MILNLCCKYTTKVKTGLMSRMQMQVTGEGGDVRMVGRKVNGKRG